jgi:hypothetical protein
MGASTIHIWPPHKGPLFNLTWDGKLGATALRAARLAFLSLMELSCLSPLLEFVAFSSTFAVCTRLN